MTSLTVYTSDQALANWIGQWREGGHPFDNMTTWSDTLTLWEGIIGYSGGPINDPQYPGAYSWTPTVFYTYDIDSDNNPATPPEHRALSFNGVERNISARVSGNYQFTTNVNGIAIPDANGNPTSQRWDGILVQAIDWYDGNQLIAKWEFTPGNGFLYTLSTTSFVGLNFFADLRANNYIIPSGHATPNSGQTGWEDLFGGNDSFDGRGSSANQEYHGGEGADTIRGGSGNDELYGGEGGDAISSGGGADHLYGEGGDDTFSGAGGPASSGLVIDGGTGINTIIIGGSGNSGDVSQATLVNIQKIQVFAGEGTVSADQLTAISSVEGSFNPLNPTDFAETLTVKGVQNGDFGFVQFTHWGDLDRLQLIGTAGSNVITATARNDVIRGLAGPDQLYGLGGNDLFLADNTVTAGTIYHGGEGTDSVGVRDADADISQATLDSIENISINNGNFLLDAQQFYTPLFQPQITTVTGTVGAADTLTVNIKTDNPAVLDNVSFNNWTVGEDHIQINGLYYDQFGNGSVAFGPSIAATFQGGIGNDAFYAGAGNDTMTGGAGQNYFDGGAGGDRFIGGDSIDTMSYRSASSGIGIFDRPELGPRGDADGDTFENVERVEGSDFNDNIYWRLTPGVLSNGSLRVRGYGGDDVLAGAIGGGNVLDGGDGNDLMYSRGIVDHFFGGSGIDTVNVGLYRQTTPPAPFVALRVILPDSTPQGTIQSADFFLASNLLGTIASDVENIVGTGGYDQITGNKSNNELRGGDGVDTIEGGLGADSVFGGIGNDILYGNTLTGAGAPVAGTVTGDGDDKIYGENGDDTIYGNQGNDTCEGGLGDDSINGGFGDDILYGNTLTGAGAPVAGTVTGDGDDKLYGNDGNDRIFGNQGNDTCEGGLGVDTINGGFGNDTIYGNTSTGAGAPVVGTATDDGADMLYGNDGDDTIFGNQGNDICEGGLGVDTINGGFGDDTIYGNTSTGAGAPVVGTATDDGDDKLYGNDGNDTIYGNQGNDTLDGGIGNDILYGGFGNDTLLGGTGNDTLTGNVGTDNFTFAAGWGQDTITDFELGIDKIDMRSFNITMANLSIQTSGADAVIYIAGQTGPGSDIITVTGRAGQLTPNDFRFV